ncbi:unnamed protein product [Polarella glacialis]|uniref:CCHC-type domain-containing protein n=1 Tax=Polarella glacialis TaxID=89957 RepID=A0A813LVC2_POLGL|nr:unnamed protein product [Polarella glacialis]
MATPMDVDCPLTMVPAPQRGEGRRTSFQDAAIRVCDFKGLARPPTFSGRDQDWPEFRYRFESLATLLGFDQLLDQASKVGFDGLDVDLFTEEDYAKSRFVHAILVQLCSGKALSLVKLTPKVNGFDAWSALVHEYEPELVSRYCALLAAILTPEWVPTTSFIEQLIEWERLVSRYELSSGQRLSESVKCAVILRWAPDTVKEVLKTLPADVVESYPRLRNALQQARVRALTYDSQGRAQVPEHRTTAVPMEVDALHKGKGKGKGKTQQPASQSGKDRIQCQWCGKIGHVLKDCYKFLEQGGFDARRPVQKDQPFSKGQGVHALGDAPWNETLSGVWRMPEAAMETQTEWCMQLADAQPKASQDRLMVDSGAFDHVCPVAFMPDVPIQPMDGDTSPAITADGTPLVAIGHKVVHCVLQTGRRLRIRFKVMPLKRPLLSVGRLRRQGFGSYFPPEPSYQGGGEAFLTHQGEKVPLQEHRGLFFLDVCFPNVNALDEQQGQPGLEDLIEPLSWCPTCVASRAADAKHGGYGFAAVSPTKGRGSTGVIQGMLRFLAEAGLTGRLTLRSDQEMAVQAVVQAVAAQRQAPTMVEVTPKGSSSSLGTGEKYIRDLMSQVRVCCEQVQQIWGQHLAASSSLMPWVVAHAAWTMNRFSRDAPYTKAQGHEYHGAVFRFSEPVMVKNVGNLTRLQPRWTPGVWLGRTSDGDENLAATAQGLLIGRSARAMERAVLPEDLLAKAVAGMSTPRPQFEETEPPQHPQDRQTPAVHVGPSRATGGAAAPRGVELRAFHQAMGRCTPRRRQIRILSLASVPRGATPAEVKKAYLEKAGFQFTKVKSTLSVPMGIPTLHFATLELWGIYATFNMTDLPGGASCQDFHTPPYLNSAVSSFFTAGTVLDEAEVTVGMDKARLVAQEVAAGAGPEAFRAVLFARVLSEPCGDPPEPGFLITQVPRHRNGPRCPGCGDPGAMATPMEVDCPLTMVPAPQRGEGRRTSFQDAAIRVCDFKGLARPPTFSGRDQDWPEFRYRFESLATLLGFDQLLDQASKVGFDGLDVDLFTEEDYAKSRFVHAILVQLCSGKALSLVKLTPKVNGFDAWSALVHEYEPELVSRYCALLAAILTPEWAPTTSFIEQLIEWERLVSRYELSSGQRLAESVKCAVILRWAPDTVKEVLKTLPADVVESYPRLRNALQQARVRALTYDSQGRAQVPEHRTTAVPMEVDALNKGKGKGKGKTQQPVSQSGKDRIQCQWCGKIGHVLKDCYKFLEQGGFDARRPVQKDQPQGVHALGDAPWNETLSGVWKMPDAAMETQPEWCMQLADAQPKASQDRLMVDSGAFDHVCPVAFMPDVPIQPMDGDTSPAITADGTPLVAIGHKVVHCVLQTGRRLRIRFKVMPIKRPLLSVGRLRRQGFGSYFPPEPSYQGGGEAFLTHQGEKVPLQEHRGLFFLDGRGSTGVIQGMLRFLAEAGLTGRLTLRSDQEMAVQAVVQAVAAQRQAPTMVEVTPKGSSSSLGTGEKYIRDLMSQVRVCCEQVQQIWGQHLAASSSLMPWVVAHAAWTMNRFSRDAPYTKAQGHEYHGAVFRFSEPVMVKNVGNLTRLQPRWTPGVWLGRTSDGDENLAATAQGLLIGRSARAMERAVLPEDLLAKAVAGMSTPRPQVEETELPQYPQDRQTPAVHVGPSRATGGAAAPRGVELRAFHQAMGRTPGCVACDEPGGKQHTAKCKWRRAHWQEQAAETASEPTAKRRAVEVPEEDAGLVPRRITGKSLAPSWAPAGPGDEEMPGTGAKRTAEDDGAWEQEEVEARLRTEPDEEMAEQEIAVVNHSSKTEPPWHSDRDGSLLDPDQLRRLTNVCAELGQTLVGMLLCDSSAALAVPYRRGTGRMRHLEAKDLWLQEEFRRGHIKFQKIATADHVADLLTKPLTGPAMRGLCADLGLMLQPGELRDEVNVLEAHPPPTCERCQRLAEYDCTYAGQLFWRCPGCHRTKSWHAYQRGWTLWQEEGVPASSRDDQQPLPPTTRRTATTARTGRSRTVASSSPPSPVTQVYVTTGATDLCEGAAGQEACNPQAQQP